jgi:HEAT repeat protein
MSETIIPFDVQGRLLAKARGYAQAPDQLIQDGPLAVEPLVRALPLADGDLKLKIVLMLGTMADPRVVEPLYALLRDETQADNLRQAAAVQLSLVGALLPSTRRRDLAERLIADLAAGNAPLRGYAAFALGWESNQAAVAPLVDALCDEDLEVQQAAVSALTNINDDRLFTALAGRLKRGAKEQQRAILYHLSCFSRRRAEIATICAEFLGHRDADLRYDALVVLDTVSQTEKPLEIYLHCLQDGDPRIREQALTLLAHADRQRLKAILPHLQPLLHDPDAALRQAAVRLLHRINGGPAPLQPEQPL